MPTLPIVTPILWDEFGSVANGDVRGANSAGRLAKGDVFAQQVHALAAQRFADVRP